MRKPGGARAPNNAPARATAGVGGLLLSASVLSRRSVGPRETALFRAVNGLPDALFVPTWVVMQGGTLGAAWAASALAAISGHRRLALRLGLAGTLTWALSKAIKRTVRRPRPRALIDDARVRGSEPTGLGYVSGHAGVALALALGVWTHLPRPARCAVPCLVAIVGASRIYVGAHLPLDVVGGLALALTVDALVELATGTPDWVTASKPR